MSTSPDRPDVGRLSVTSPNARISVVDAWFDPVPNATGFARLDLDLPVGAYQVRAQIGFFERAQAVLVQPGAHREVTLPVTFSTSAPIQDALNFDEVHAALVAQELDGFRRRRPEPTLLVVVRGLKPDELRNARSVQPFRLHAGPYLMPDVPPASVEGPTGLAWAWPHVLPPGLCRLRWQHRFQRWLEHALWLPPGWKVLLFVRWANGAPDLSTMSVHLVPLRRLWGPAGESEGAVEAAVTTWRDGSVVGLLESACENPMAMLLAQHHLVRTAGAGSTADPGVLEQLRQSLGDHHPDVQALVGGPPSPLPPMLSTSVRRQLNRGREGWDATWNLFQGISMQRYAGGPWLVWNPEGVTADLWNVFHRFLPPGRREEPLPVAVARLADLLRADALLEGITVEQLLEGVSTEKLADRLSTSKDYVERLLTSARALAAAPSHRD